MLADRMSARFCSQCGATITADARFCAQCGARLDGAQAPVGGWQITTGGLGVFGVLLVSGLAIWAAILSPAPPKPGPGAGPSGPTTAAADRPPPAAPIEIPGEVKSFIADLVQKAEAAPQDTALWLRLGKVYTRTGQLDPSYQPKALAAFDRVLAIDPGDREAIRGKANVFYDQGDHRKAIPLYERYLALAGDDPSARTDLATMYLSAGDGPKAVATYESVIAKHPEFLQAHYNLAVTHAQLGDTDAALAGFKKARTLAPDDRTREQIDTMIARVGGAPPAPPPAPSAPAAPGPSTAGSPFQQDVEKRLRAAPIMGERIVRVEWNGPASARVSVQSFPMEGMPEAVRQKFVERLAQELKSAADANRPDGDVKIEIADATAGTVMATVTP